MFTVLPNTRNSRLYLMVALAIASIVLLSFAMAPSISLRNPAAVLVTGAQNIGAASVERTSTLSFRHAEQIAAAVDAEKAYQAYRQGERGAGNAVQVAQPQLSFRQAEQMAASADAQNAYLNYRRGEWTGE